MAAGDVTISGDSGRAIRGKRIVWGTVQLDGSNPTPVDLSAYMSAVERATLSHETTSAPGDDPITFTPGYSSATLNVYAWKYTSGADPTLVASTNNTNSVAFIAIGKA